MAAADLLTWLLLVLQSAITAACAVLLARRHTRDVAQLDRSIHRAALALLIVAAMPLPALLTTDAPAGAWGLWGAGYIAGALVYAFADTLRDTQSADPAGSTTRPAAAHAGPARVELPGRECARTMENPWSGL